MEQNYELDKVLKTIEAFDKRLQEMEKRNAPLAPSETDDFWQTAIRAESQMGPFGEREVKPHILLLRGQMSLNTAIRDLSNKLDVIIALLRQKTAS